jgi:hypothetical protein
VRRCRTQRFSKAHEKRQGHCRRWRFSCHPLFLA